MFSKLLSSGAKLRFALWVIGNVMPSKANLMPHINKMVAVVIAVIVCGVFAAFGAISAVIVIYLYATGLAVAHQTALFFLSASMLIIALLGHMIASRTLCRMLAVSEEKPASKVQARLNELGNTLDETIDSFISGFLTKPTPKHTSTEDAKDAGVSSDDRVVPIIQVSASASEILHRHPKTQATY